MSDLNINKKIVIIVMAFILTLAVGYAIFSESLNINGSAGTGSTNFNIVFDRVGEITEVEASSTTADIQDEGKKLAINVPGLKMPTAYAKIPVTIKNKGDITAKVKQIKAVGLDTTDIKVTYEGVKQEDIFNPNDEKELIVKVTWDEASTKTSVEASFSVEIDFEQVTSSDGNITTTPSGGMSDPRYVYEGTKLVRLTEEGVNYYKNPENTVIEIPEGTTEIGGGAFVIPVGYDVSTLPDWDYLDEMMSKYTSSSNVSSDQKTKFEQEENKMMTLMSASMEFTKIFKGKTLNLPDSISKIGMYSYGFIGLSGELKLPANLTKIGSGAFSSNAFSGTIEIPNGVTYIGGAAFGMCDYITGLKLSNSLEIIGIQAFYQDRNLKGELKLPDGLLEIRDSAFAGARFAGELYVPDSVKEIGKSAFSYGQFTSISISSNTKYVEDGSNPSFPSGISVTKR